jgi:hypothetical protein
MTQQVQKIGISRYYGQSLSASVWAREMAEMVKAYIRGEPQFVEFDGSTDARRTGSIGRIVISDEEMQNILHGATEYRGYYNRGPARQTIEVKEENVDALKLERYNPTLKVKWDGRSNSIDASWGAHWLKGYDASQGTKWVWAKPEDPPAITPKDKLGREIKKGDFISYILYHFDNSHNAAGIYYGKVSKIENDGTVHAKNIKLKEDDRVDEKRIKDNSLIVIMSKDLMDKLMLARLSIL